MLTYITRTSVTAKILTVKTNTWIWVSVAKFGELFDTNTILQPQVKSHGGKKNTHLQRVGLRISSSNAIIFSDSNRQLYCIFFNCTQASTLCADTVFWGKQLLFHAGGGKVHATPVSTCSGHSANFRCRYGPYHRRMRPLHSNLTFELVIIVVRL